MYSLGGFVNGNTISTREDLYAFEGRKVIITILDETMEMWDQSSANMAKSKRKAAAREIAGMWSSHDDGNNVDATVRNLRRGRQFDL